MGSGLPTFMVGKSAAEYMKQGQTAVDPKSNNTHVNVRLQNTTSRDSIMSVDFFSEPVSLQCSSLNSYTSLAGFETHKDEFQEKNPKEEVNPQLLQKLELQGYINDIVQKIVSANIQLFVRSIAMSVEDQVKVFGETVLNVSEVLSTQGIRVLLVGRIDYWKNCFNLTDPPIDRELQRYSFVNQDGEKIFQCSLFTNVMKINMGTFFIGQLTLKKQISLDCSDWDLSTMIVEDRYADQVIRFERNKTQFDVLLYPEQLKLCQISSTRWNAKQFLFFSKSSKRIFSIPLPDEFALTFRKKALLLTSSIYLYDKYYHRSKKCRIFIGIFTFVSIVLIAALIIVERLDLFLVSS